MKKLGIENVNNYKFDERTQEEFIRDLQYGLSKEVQAINTFRDILNKSYIGSPELVYIGSEEEGQVAYSGSEVSNINLFPDYLLKYKEHMRARFNFIEVKTCSPQSEFAYFKTKQLHQYEELGKVFILFVMGASTNHPKFILVTPQQIFNLGVEPEIIYGKETLKCHISKFHWEPFTPFKRRYNLLEKNFLAV